MSQSWKYVHPNGQKGAFSASDTKEALSRAMALGLTGATLEAPNGTKITVALPEKVQPTTLDNQESPPQEAKESVSENAKPTETMAVVSSADETILPASESDIIARRLFYGPPETTVKAVNEMMQHYGAQIEHFNALVDGQGKVQLFVAIMFKEKST